MARSSTGQIALSLWVSQGSEAVRAYLGGLPPPTAGHRGPAAQHPYWDTPAEFVADMGRLRGKMAGYGCIFTQPEVARWLNRHSTINGRPREGQVFPMHLHRWAAWAGCCTWADLIACLETR